MLIPMKELNSMKPDINGSRTSIYYLDENILAKRFKNLSDREKRELLKKYQLSKTFSKINNLSLPIDILETEKGICGYIESIIPGIRDGSITSFVDYFHETNGNFKLEELTDYMLKVNDIVESCHENGIVNPDMSSEGNVWFDTKSKEVFFMDYQGMQVQDISTSAINSFIAFDPVIKLPKYYKKSFYSPNIDLYTMAIRYFYYATKINIPKTMFLGGNIKELIKEVGISGTEFADCLQVLYDPDKDNLDIRNAIIDLTKDFELPEIKKGQARRLVRK